MNHSPASNTCDVCRHWDNDGMSPYGTCRKNPPTGSGWPRVSRKDWCGEYGLPVPEAQSVSNPLLPYETAEGNRAETEPVFNDTVFLDGPDFDLSPPEKRRPGRPRKVQP